jgi:hypothetical protein
LSFHVRRLCHSFAPELVSNVDAAIFTLEKAVAQGRSITPRVVGHTGDPAVLIPRVSAVATPTQPGTMVIKRGFVSGVTKGFIIGVNSTVNWSIGGANSFLVDQYEIRGAGDNPNGLFGIKGDSGSLVLQQDTQTAIGLLYGANTLNGGTANTIANVQSQLGVKLVF